MVESNSSCLETYKITISIMSVYCLVAKHFFQMLKGENSTPLDVIICMLEMNNQQRKKLYQAKRSYVKTCPLAAGLYPQRVINEWNKLSNVCVNVSNVNMIKYCRVSLGWH